jgi:phosphatidylglycerophosphate synthase
MLANCITLSRFPLLLAWILVLYLGAPPLRLAGVALLFVGIMLDTVDGVVARRTGRTSLFGSVLDIAADRTYELVLWVCFANLGMIPSVIPLIIVARTTLTDALRSLGVAEGTAPFAQPRSAVARFLVGSPLMRTGYSVTKLMAFCGLALAEALSGFPAGATLGISVAPMLAVLQVIAWSAVIFCVCRGLPVLVGGIPRLRDA